MKDIQNKIIAGMIAMALVFVVGCGVLGGGIWSLNNLPVGAATYTDEYGEWVYVEIDGGLRIYKYTGTNANIITPSMIDGKTVIEFGYQSFMWCNKIESITISNGVEIIGEGAFYGCDKLVNVTFPETLKRIGSASFMDFKGTSITFPESLEFIGDNAFARSKLESVVFPASTITIDAWSFTQCPNLTEITFYGDDLTIGLRAFWWCTSLTDVDFQGTVLSIGEMAFLDCPLGELKYVKSERLTEEEFNDMLTNAGVDTTTDIVHDQERPTQPTSPTAPVVEGSTDGTITTEDPDTTTSIALIVTGIILAVLALSGAGFGVFYLKKHNAKK